MSPSRLLGREPTVTRTITRNWLGLPTKIVEVREPEWKEADLLAVLAQRREEQKPRGTHGRLLEEATDPKNRGRYTAQATSDFAAAALSQAQKTYREKYPDDDMDSMLWSVELKP